MENKAGITLTLFGVAVSMWLAAWVLSVFDALWAIFGVFALALAFSFVYTYPLIKKQLKLRILLPNPKNVKLIYDNASNSLVLKNSEKRATDVFIKTIKIGTSEKWFINKSFPLNNDANILHFGLRENIAYIKINDTLGFYTFEESKTIEKIESQKFSEETLSFDVYAGLKFNRKGADHDRFWKIVVDFKNGNIQVVVKDIRW